MLSNRQSFFLIALELFSIVTLILPQFLSKTLSQDAPAGLITGFLFAFIFAFLLKRFFDRFGETLLSDSVKKNILIQLLLLLCYIQTVLVTVFIINMCEDLVALFLLPDTSRLPIIVTFYALCMAASAERIEIRARMAEFTGSFFVVIFIIILLFAIRKVDLNQYETLLFLSQNKIIKSGYEVFIFIQSIYFSIFSAFCLNDKKDYGKVLKKSLLFLLGFSFVLLMILTGTFGTTYVGEMNYSAIRLLRNIMQGGGFFSRPDVLMTGVWLLSMFFFVSGGLQYSKKIFSFILDDSKKTSHNIVSEVIIFVLALFCGNKENSYYIYRNFSYYIAAPAIIILLIVLVFFPFKKEKNNTAHIEG